MSKRGKRNDYASFRGNHTLCGTVPNLARNFHQELFIILAKTCFEITENRITTKLIPKGKVHRVTLVSDGLGQMADKVPSASISEICFSSRNYAW